MSPRPRKLGKAVQEQDQWAVMGTCRQCVDFQTIRVKPHRLNLGGQTRQRIVHNSAPSEAVPGNAASSTAI